MAKIGAHCPSNRRTWVVGIKNCFVWPVLVFQERARIAATHGCEWCSHQYADRYLKPLIQSSGTLKKRSSLLPTCTERHIIRQNGDTVIIWSNDAHLEKLRCSVHLLYPLSDSSLSRTRFACWFQICSGHLSHVEEPRRLVVEGNKNLEETNAGASL